MTIDLEKLNLEFKTKAKKCDSLDKKILFCESFLKKYRQIPDVVTIPILLPSQQIQVSCEVDAYKLNNDLYLEKDIQQELTKRIMSKLLDGGFIQQHSTENIQTFTKRYGMTIWVARR